MSLGVRSGLLSLSQLTPILGGSLAWFVLAAFGADDLIRRRPSVRTYLALAALPLLVALLGVAAVPGLADSLGVVTGLVLFVASMALAWRGRAALVALALVSTLWYAPRMILDRSPESIHFDSPLVESLREHTERGSRFALVGRVPMISNQEGMLGLRSIHTYNPLMTESYRAWIPTVAGKEIPPYSRHFQALASVDVVGTPAFSFTGVDVLVTTEVAARPELELVRAYNGLQVYRVRRPAPLEAQVAEARREGEGRFRIDGDLREAPRLPVRRVEGRDDRLVFEVSSTSEPTLLFVSQQFHPQWRAHSGSEPLRTVRVNDFYQGVVVPPGVGSVTLEFVPASLWSWLPQVGFVVAAGVVGLRWGRRRAAYIPSE
jgi:hypothetical protein